MIIIIIIIFIIITINISIITISDDRIQTFEMANHRNDSRHRALCSLNNSVSEHRISVFWVGSVIRCTEPLECCHSPAATKVTSQCSPLPGKTHFQGPSSPLAKVQVFIKGRERRVDGEENGRPYLPKAGLVMGPESPDHSVTCTLDLTYTLDTLKKVRHLA